jgi:hypothetical protein
LATSRQSWLVPQVRLEVLLSAKLIPARFLPQLLRQPEQRLLPRLVPF